MRLALQTRRLRAALRNTTPALDALDSEAAARIMGALHARARMLHRGALGEYLLSSYPPRSADLWVLDAALRDLARTDPDTWLANTPLMRALAERAAI
jgi:hypothetical protein